MFIGLRRTSINNNIHIILSMYGLNFQGRINIIQ